MKTTREIGAEPLFVYLPVGSETYSLEPSRTEVFFTDYCARKSIRCRSLRPRFQSSSEAGLDLGRVFHWNELGHRVAAEGIAEFVAVSYPERVVGSEEGVDVR